VKRGTSAGRRAWYGAALAAGVTAVLLAPVAHTPGEWVERAAWNAAHAPLFAIACFAILWLWGDPPPRVRWIVAAGLATFGALTEGLQFYTGRTPSLSDFTTDLLGISIGWAGWLLMRRAPGATTRPSRTMLLACVLLPAAIVAAPIVRAIDTRIAQARAFPLLFDPAFGRALEMVAAFGGTDPDALASSAAGLSVPFPAGGPSGILITRFPGDWRGFERVVIDVENAGAEELPLRIAIGDAASALDFSERYRTRVTLPPQARMQLPCPLDDVAAAPGARPMRLDEMSAVTLIRPRGAAGEFVLHSIRLE
jgi:VanZ family protein